MMLFKFRASVREGAAKSPVRSTALFLVFLTLVLCPSAAPAVAQQSPTYSISGQVTDGFGNAIAGATVTLQGTQAATTTADASGNYRFANLRAGGNYTLSASRSVPDQSFVFVVFVNNLSSDRTVNLILERAVTVTLHVTDASGQGVAGVSFGTDNLNSPSLPQTNSAGMALIAVGVPDTGSVNITLTPAKPGYSFTPSSVSFESTSGSQSFSFKAGQTGGAASYFQFSSANYTVSESEPSASVTVTRTGDTSGAASVPYTSSDGTATQQKNYTMAGGTLRFAPGETSKPITVLITDEAYVEGSKTLNLQLGTPTGAGAYLGSQTSATLTITDNDTAPPTTNPSDDAAFFVRQHYSDFLARLPDQDGLNYWTGQIAQCGSDAACLSRKRIDVSAAFFIEQEFQQTSYVVYRLNVAALGGLVPTYTHFMMDRNELIGGPDLQQSVQDFASAFVERGIFKQFYPDTMTPADFVNKLFDNARLTPYTNERQQEIQAMTGSGKTRAQVLLDVIEMPELKTREYNRAFVLTQYYGYLRRDPDPAGYSFWLNVLNNRLPGDAGGYRSMVCAFITSAEYQDRFSPVHTHSNSECSP